MGNISDRAKNNSPWTGASGDVRYTYTYDYNGNLTDLKKETKSGSTWSQTDRWAYTWTTRDQMNNHSVIPATHPVIPTKVGIQGPAFPAWIPAFAGMTMLGSRSDPGTLQNGRRYEYDGLNLVRVDEEFSDRYSALDGNSLFRTGAPPSTLANLVRPLS